LELESVACRPRYTGVNAIFDDPDPRIMRKAYAEWESGPQAGVSEGQVSAR